MWYAWVPEAKKYKLGIVNNNNNIEERLSTFTITLFDLSLLKKKKKYLISKCLYQMSLKYIIKGRLDKHYVEHTVQMLVGS